MSIYERTLEQSWDIIKENVSDEIYKAMKSVYYPHEVHNKADKILEVISRNKRYEWMLSRTINLKK